MRLIIILNILDLFFWDAYGPPIAVVQFPDWNAHPSSLCGKASNDKSKNVKDAAVATSKTIMGTLAGDMSTGGYTWVDLGGPPVQKSQWLAYLALP